MKKYIIIIIAIALQSCRLADYTLLSTKSVDIKTENKLLKPQCVGKATSLRGAIDKCIENGGGTYIENVVIYDLGWNYKVTGDVHGK